MDNLLLLLRVIIIFIACNGFARNEDTHEGRTQDGVGGRVGGCCCGGGGDCGVVGKGKDPSRSCFASVMMVVAELED